MIDQTSLAIPAAPDRGWRWTPVLGFAALIALMLALYHEVVSGMVTTWWNTVTYNHGFLVLPTSLWLVWRQRRRLWTETARPTAWALPVLAGAGLVWLVGEAAEANLVRQVALVTMIIGVVVLGFGRRIGSILAFPLLFLFFMVPFGDYLIPQLQDVTATFAVEIIRAVGIPVFRDGIMIQIPNGLFEVAEACAGIRFLIANIFVVALFSYLAYRRWWKVVIMLALGMIVPILANGLRAAGIILIAHWSDNQIATGVDHLVYGWGFFAVVMVILLLIGESFADQPVVGVPLRPGSTAPTAIAPTGRRSVLILAAGALILAAAPVYAHYALKPPATGLRHEPVLPAVAGWAIDPAPSHWTPQFEGADRQLLGRYRSPAGAVELYIAYYAWQRHGAEVVYHANRFADGKDWIRISAGSAPIAVGRHTGAALPPQARYERLSSPAGQRVVVSWYWVAGRFTNDPITAKWLQVLARLTGGDQAAAAVAVAADFTELPADGLRRIERFLADAGDLSSPLTGSHEGRADGPTEGRPDGR